MTQSPHHHELQPFDSYNQTLVANVHPPDWENPTPAGRYHLVVIGGGTAGLVTAAGAAGLGAKVALVERGLLGGDCLNVGCVPSKALVSAARVAATIRDAGQFGVTAEDYRVDFDLVMQRMRRLRAEISPHDSARRFQELGVDVFLGHGQFASKTTISVDGQILSFKRAVIATGARAELPAIAGIEKIKPLTNESLFSLIRLPERLTILGAGPIGCEMAQAFARFGSRVTLIEKADRILPREDADAAKIVQDALRRDGVTLLLGATVKRFETRGDAKIAVCEIDSVVHELAADEVLISAGRTPNVQGMGLENAGVRFDEHTGVHVNDRMQTSNKMIYAAGDVASKWKFTHAADFLARLVIGNTLFLGRSKASDLVIPWTTYTSPELAHVGLHPDQAAREGIKTDTFTQHLSGVDRAILEGRSAGFVRVHVRQGTDRIIGATVVAENAGEMISEITLAMTHGLGLKKIASSIHPYPTYSEAIRKLGDQYNKTRLTAVAKGIIGTWLSWTR